MLTFIILYSFFYLLTFLFLFYFLFLGTVTTASLKYSFTSILRFIKQYTQFTFFFNFLALMLIGLPPFILFFPKLYLILEIFTKSILWWQCSLIFFFFISTLFYFQFFKITNLSLPILNPLKFMQKSPDKNLYTSVYLFMFFLCTTALSVVFFSDLFLIIV